MKLAIKICGMLESDNIMAAAALMPDIMGFIFYPGSPRFAGDSLDPEVLLNLPSEISKAGVFVNANHLSIAETIHKYSLDIVQLHGDEPPDLCMRLKNRGIRVIKAFNIKNDAHFSSFSKYLDCTDFFLFDTSSKERGGSGQRFDWKLLDEYASGHPFFLSGGISPGDADKIMRINNPSFHGVDLNSRFETEPGIKNIEKLKTFIDELRKQKIIS